MLTNLLIAKKQVNNLLLIQEKGETNGFEEIEKQLNERLLELNKKKPMKIEAFQILLQIVQC